MNRQQKTRRHALPLLLLGCLLGAACLFGCTDVDGTVEKLKGWKVPEDKSVRKIKLKYAWVKPVADVVALKEDAVEPCLKRLSSFSAEDACGVMVALGYLHAAKAVDPLVEVLKKEEGEAGAYAAFALVKLKKQGSLDKVKALAGDMASLPSAARTNVYRVFAWAREAKHYDVLVAGIAETDPAVQAAVLGLLKTTNHDSLVAPLVKALGEADEAVARGAGQVLAYNKEHLEDRDVLPLLGSEKPWVREQAVFLLGRLKGKKARQAVAAGLADKSPKVAVTAAEALAESDKRPDDGAIRRIASLLGLPDEAVAKRAHSALLKIGKTAPARDVYVTLLDSDKAHAVLAAAELLIQCRPFGSVSPLTDLTGVTEIPKLMALLESEDKDTAMAAGATLRHYTNQTFDDVPKLWAKWWEAHKVLMQYVGKAQRLVKQVKAWKKEGTLGQHKEEAVQALEEATRLYEEAEEKRLTRMGFDNKHVEINQLLRVVRTSGG